MVAEGCSWACHSDDLLLSFPMPLFLSNWLMHKGQYLSPFRLLQSLARDVLKIPPRGMEMGFGQLATTYFSSLEKCGKSKTPSLN